MSRVKYRSLWRWKLAFHHRSEHGEVWTVQQNSIQLASTATNAGSGQHLTTDSRPAPLPTLDPKAP